MAFPVNEELRNYDVFPKVLVKDKPTTVHIRPLGCRKQFEPGKEYTCVICPLELGAKKDYPFSSGFDEFKAVCNENGGFDISYTFKYEMMHFIRFLDDEDERIEQFRVYCVDKDLEGRWPLNGDLHMHTNRSDGRQDPEVVCANYRRHGYDFMVISDHRRYYPSLDAIDFYKDVKIGLTIVPGEEVHMPSVDESRPDYHIVNFGGKYSINALTEGDHIKEVGSGKDRRSIDGNCPETLPLEQWQQKMRELAKDIKVPEGIDPVQAAMCKWTFDEIRKAEGLGIFPHPTWINNVYHVPDIFVDYITENRFFDAFEVYGGERYYEQNGFQMQKYYADKAKGINYPVVGSTDSHSSYASNDKAFVCSTIVFSPANEREALIKSVKDFYSVAVDTIDENYRLAGDVRLVKYASFLLNSYFPLHDELCFEEGRLMKQFAKGTDEEKAEAKAVLDIIGGRIQKHREKYFDF